MIDMTTTYTLGWTLIHSFWQLTVLAVIFYFLMVMCKQSRPAIRYLLSLFFMIASVSLTGLTFLILHSKYAIPTAMSQMAAPSITTINSAEDASVSTGFWQATIAYLESNITSLTYMYMIGLVLLLVRMIISYMKLNRLKYQSETIPDKQLNFLPDLIKNMNLNRSVDIRSTVNSDMPMVIGSLQPVVLIPLSLLSSTSPGILKAIIAHELAHIERHDFIVNICQSVIETLFFYHPAVWYFSYIARRERELCCDQRATEVGCHKEELARAISVVGDLQRPSEWAMTLGGPPEDLLNRVKYLLGYQPSFHYIPTNSVWYYGSLLGVFLLFSIGKSQFSSQRPDKDDPEIYSEWIDTIAGTHDQDIIRTSDSRKGGLDWTDTIPLKSSLASEHTIRINSVESMVQVDPADTIPKVNTEVVVKADNTVITIQNGDTTIVINPEIAGDALKLQKSLDSTLITFKKLKFKWPDQKMDSLVTHQLQELKSQHNYLKIQHEHLDSLNKNLRHDHSIMKSFRYSLPDSFPDFNFTMPPSLDIDSLFHRHFLENFKGGLSQDSMVFLPGGEVKMFTDPDSLDYSFLFHHEEIHGFSPGDPKFKEMQELDKEIRAKEKELRELRKEKWNKYLKELQKSSKENKK